jgi:hypothetical protein
LIFKEVYSIKPDEIVANSFDEKVQLSSGNENLDE